MGFANIYREYGFEKNGVEPKLPKRDSCILPFLGFEYTTDVDRNYYAVDMGYHVTQEAGSLHITKNHPATGSSIQHSITFYRNQTPTGKVKEVEDRIYSILSRKYTKKVYGRTELDVYKTPYFHPSLSEYYKNVAPPTSSVGCAITVISLLICIAIFIYGFFHASGPNAGNVSAALMIWPAIAFIVIICIASYAFSRADKQYLEEHPFYKLPKHELEEWRQKYLNSLTIYDEEGDKLLREYAILRGYDRK